MRNRLSELIPTNTSLDNIAIIIEQALTGVILECITQIGFVNKQLLLVCDSQTHDAFGKQITYELSSLKPELLVFEEKLYADESVVKRINSHTYDALIAIGSGTINDLCKYSSFVTGKPYAVFPTAPSMNGYLSANASITIEGHKHTLPAHLPKGVFCDLNILINSPARLIRSGLGDSLCRSTAQADWLLSHLLLGTPYNALPFDMLLPYEKELFARADKLLSGDLAVMKLLIKTLLVSGAGMTIAGGSYPASQGEHLIAHTMEMMHGCNVPETFHGEQIGVTTLTMAKIQQDFLSKPLQLPPEPDWQHHAKTPTSLEACRKKYAFYERYDEINTFLKKSDEDIRNAIKAISLPEALLRDVLTKAGAPANIEDLGWRQENFTYAVTEAHYMRDRFTFLDLLN
jgi:glycerol-1-phosphate dehydrogenase [NAD(P)+]